MVRVGAVLGTYEIIELIGEGGMGAVYEAEQDQPRRKVALKVIKSAWADRELLRRFELESRWQAFLDRQAEVLRAAQVELPAGNSD